MTTPAEPRLEDDASGEAWYQKGVTLLEGRKQERKWEEEMRGISVMHEWQFWLGVMWVLMLVFNAGRAGADVLTFIAAVSAVVSFACAIDGAGSKRTQSMLDWIEHQRSKDTPPGIDSPPHEG